MPSLQNLSAGDESLNREQPLYRSIAERMEHLIEDGTFRVGDRLPSVRGLRKDWGISLTTAMEAYRILENRGLIEARPQSGYYVRPRMARIIAEPRATAPVAEPSEIEDSELTHLLHQDTHNAKLLQLGAAIPSPDLLPHEKLGRVLAQANRAARHRSVEYSMGPGLEALRREAARRAVSAGCALSPDDFLVTNGCSEAVFLCLKALCKPGDAVAVESPFYFGFVQILQSLDLKIVELPTNPREGICLDTLSYVINNHSIKAVLMSTNYSNPLGATYSTERKKRLVKILADAEIPLIEDDIYGELTWSQERPCVAKAFDEKGLVLYCTSISKTLAPGWRIGWVAPGRYLKEVQRLKNQVNLSNASPMQYAAAEFLSNGGYDHHLRKMRKTLSERAEFLMSEITRWFPSSTRMTQPGGGYVLWLELPPAMDSVELYTRAKAAGMTIAPGKIFSARGQYRNCLRLNVAFATPEHSARIQKLGALVNEMLSRATVDKQVPLANDA